MPDVSSNAPVDVRLWIAVDVHKLSIVAATSKGVAVAARASGPEEAGCACFGRAGWPCAPDAEAAGS